MLGALVLLSVAAAVEPAHFHHVELNVMDREASIAYYSHVFGATPTRFRGVSDALFTERSFILLNEVIEAPDPALNTGIWHIGWGGVDVKSEYAWWSARGIRFHTPLTPLPGKDNYYMYFQGPDNELIEMNTMGHRRFGHVHLWATDVDAVTNWYTDNLGLESRGGRVTADPTPGSVETLGDIWMNMFRCDNVLFIVFEKPTPTPSWWTDPPIGDLNKTDGRPIDHFAFSYRDIGPVYERMKANGVEIVSEPAMRDVYHMKSFFIRGPEQVLIEIVEAPPIPDESIR